MTNIETHSANTLFHFTGELKNLLGILKNKVYVRYSLEDYDELLEGRKEVVLPMACFCDIPLSRIKSHTEKYGSYALGLSKSWGIKNGLSPVIYTTKESETASILNELVDDLGNFFDISNFTRNEDPDLTKSQKTAMNLEKAKTFSGNFMKTLDISGKLGHFLKYIKPYEGIGYSNGNKFDKIRFYDESEWRYIPPKKLLSENGIKDSYNKSFYTDSVKRRYINIQLAGCKKLDFSPNDIRFIVVKTNEEIPGLIKEIREIFSSTVSYDDIMLLITRIISLEQVIDDL